MNFFLRSNRVLSLAFGLTVFTGCGELAEVDVADDAGQVMTNRAALTAASECVSARVGISDAWCRAVQCAEVYVSGGFCQLAGDAVDALVEGAQEAAEEAADEVVEDAQEEAIEEAVEAIEQPVADAGQPFYPNWTEGTCLNDGKAPAWERQLYADASVCCKKHFNWKLEACGVESGAALTPVSAVEDAIEEDEAVEEAEEDLVEEAEEEIVEEAEEELVEEVVEEVVEEAEEEVVEEDEEDFVEEVIVAPGLCPTGWDRRQKDCAGLPWQHSARWHCTQSLPPANVQSCDAEGADFTKETCGVSRGAYDATWCVNPTPTAPLVCGGHLCDVPAAGNRCNGIPAGGRGAINWVCPN